MSDRNRQNAALLRAVDERLRTLLSDDIDPTKPGKFSGVTSLGKPPSWAGTLWYGIHAKGFAGNSNSPQYHERLYGFRITVTIRVDAKPKDRLGNALLMAVDSGLLDRADEIAEWFHGDYTLLALANEKMRSAQAAGVDIDQGFQIPAYFRSASDPDERGPDWFGADPEKGPAAGVSCTLLFDGMTFIRGTA